MGARESARERERERHTHTHTHTKFRAKIVLRGAMNRKGQIACQMLASMSLHFGFQKAGVFDLDFNFRRYKVLQLC